MSSKYNGWTNYETWAVKLWIDNEQNDYRFWLDTATEVYNNAEEDKTFSKEERAKLNMADRLKEEYENAMHDWLDESKKSASIWADLLNTSLSEVNWYEIAEHLIDEHVDSMEPE